MAKGSLLRIEDVLSDYRIGQKLGVGARSEVYEVERREGGGLFAAKFVPVRTKEGLRIVEHLQNEYEVLRAIQEETTSGVHVAVRVVDFIRARKLFKLRAACLIMERLVGRPLSEYCDYVLDEVLTIFQQVCLGLENTHRAGFVHADLKPQNILVGENLDVKLIDFGFAAPIGRKLTSAKGTFGYIAPEQAGGTLTPKTDVFNCGAALYWVLAGQNIPSIAPGKHEAAGFVPDADIPITPPTQLNADVPQELSEMVLRCCSATPHKRPDVRELRRYLYGLALRLDYGAV
jgi:serine/threonine-protein kinase